MYQSSKALHSSLWYLHGKFQRKSEQNGIVYIYTNPGIAAILDPTNEGCYL